VLSKCNVCRRYVADVTTPASWDGVTYQDAFLWGATAKCGGFFGGAYSGKWFIGVQCNTDSDPPYVHDVVLATSTRYTVEFYYNKVTQKARIWQTVAGGVTTEVTTTGGVTKKFIYANGYASVGAVRS
jgi:hypothetical protein